MNYIYQPRPIWHRIRVEVRQDWNTFKTMLRQSWDYPSTETKILFAAIIIIAALGNCFI